MVCLDRNENADFGYLRTYLLLVKTSLLGIYIELMLLIPHTTVSIMKGFPAAVGEMQSTAE